MYVAEEVVDTVKGDLGLNDHRDVVESHPDLVSQHIENCRNRSVQRLNLERNHSLPDIAEKTLAAVSSSFMTIVWISKCQIQPPAT